MRLNNNQKIITEDDIILSDNKTLSERLSSQQTEIDKLKSNVKWIYKYGGVGSGTGGGGSSTQQFSIYATLNNIQLKDQNIILNGSNIYTLQIKINNPNNASFNVQYSYTLNNQQGIPVQQSRTVILSIENNYTHTVNINLNNNDILVIQATDGTDTKQISCNYITAPYIFKTSLVNNAGTAYTNDIFIETAKEKGLKFNLDYSISVNAEVNYKYTFLENIIEGTLTEKSGTIQFDFPQDFLIQDNANSYISNIEITVIAENQEPIILNYDLQFNLIPYNLYALLKPDTGIIYNNQSETKPYEFKAGYISFNYKIYQGTNYNRTYNVSIYLNYDSEHPEDNLVQRVTVAERSQNTFKLFSTNSGWNNVTLIVNDSIFTKYFYIEEYESEIKWFQKEEDWTQNYYRINETSDSFRQFKTKTYIEQTVNNEIISIKNLVSLDDPNQAINTHVAIGLQLNYINDDDVGIIQFINREGNVSLKLNQKSVSSNNINTSSFYIKKQEDANPTKLENYHLISIYSNFVKEINQDKYYQLSVYIDGILESSLSSIVNSHFDISEIQILPCNCYINCIDIDFRIGNNTSDPDYDVYNYYLSYKDKILNGNVFNEYEFFKYLNSFTVNENGRITITDEAAISNIARYSQIPTLMLTYDSRDNPKFGGKDTILDYIEFAYDETGSNDLGGPFNVAVSWCNGYGPELTEITFPDNIDASFKAELQGSSTKQYRVKNFNLFLQPNSESDYTYLYSPNFKNGDSTTFLPEQSFTLKADVVDSSHSNNTSCGKFVNTVCKKFVTGYSGIYNKYIKNCLEGFPILLFFKNTRNNDLGTGIINDYYFFGIYNFNLGRDSYSNLGYRDLKVFEEIGLVNSFDNNNTFTFCSILNDKLKSTLAVAEIQGNSPYFDFSQYDKSILFQNENPNDNNYMFGDIVSGSVVSPAEKIIDLVKCVSKAGGYIFESILKKNLGNQTDGYSASINKEELYHSRNQVPDYKIQWKRKEDNNYEKIGNVEQGTSNNLEELILDKTNVNGNPPRLNYQSLSEYYTICMILGLVDSVEKNLNIKTWNLESNNIPTWYLAFYDMDTCLGLNNAGRMDISYFAFSDYWYSNKETSDKLDIPGEITIYRDFSPNGFSGYDIPSSYLFAVAKYAKLNYLNEDLAEIDNFPNALYAFWRSNTENSETNEGILKNADKFMDNFFANNLGKVCPLLISYNYRSKYFKLNEQNEYIPRDFEKFNGTRLNYTREWLNGRLHILDDYFNLNTAVSNIIQWYDLKDNQWKNVEPTAGSVLYDLDPRKSNLASNYYNNEDVIILRDIFGTGDGYQLSSGHKTFTVKCPEYSPLQITTPLKVTNYIIGGDNDQQLSITSDGSQSFKFGGSQAWTELSDINWLTGVGSLIITSDKLKTIKGTTGRLRDITLNIPSLRELTLTSSQYNGSLTLDSLPNLKNINISKSSISLKIGTTPNKSGLNLNSLNLNNVTSSNITITNSTIKELYFDNIKVGTFSYNGISESNLQTVKNLIYTENQTRKTHNETHNVFLVQNTNIKNLTLTINKADCVLYIDSDPSLQSLSVGGFSKVIINNCTNLNSVNIQDNTITHLELNNCTNSKLSIYKDSDKREGIVQLSQLKNNNFTINLYGCIGIKEIYLPDNTTISSLFNLQNLEYLHGNNLKIPTRLLNKVNSTYSGIFEQCRKFKIKSSETSRPTLKPISTDLYRLFFNCTSLNIDDLNYFIDTCVPENQITNITYLCYDCSNLIYGLDEYKNGSDYVHLNEKFRKVDQASSAFFNTNITFFNKEMFNFGQDISKISFYNCFLFNGSKQVYFTIDSLINIIDKVDYLFGNYSGSSIFINFVNETGELIENEINIKDFYNPIINPETDERKYPKNLTTLGRTNFTQIINFEGVFTSEWKNFSTMLYYLYYNNRYKNISQLFKNVPTFRNLSGSLIKSTLKDENGQEEVVDLWEFMDWEEIDKRDYIFNIFQDDQNSSSFNFNKTLTANQFFRILEILKKKNVTDLSHLFCNCNITDYSNFTFTLDTSSNNRFEKVTRLTDTFNNCHVFNSGSEIGMTLDPNFFYQLPSVTSVIRTFANCRFEGNCLTFDFFNKRQENIKTGCYVKIEDEYKECKYYTYTYKQDITSFAGLFANSSWHETISYFNPSLSEGKIQKNRLVLIENPTQVFYEDFYIKTILNGKESYKKQKFTQCTEIEDMNNLEGYYVNNVKTKDDKNWDNPSVLSNVSTNVLIIPPDFFYCASTSGSNYTNVFNCSTSLFGIIPEHIFKHSGPVTNTFRNQIVFPRLIKYFEEPRGEEVVKYKIYQCYPDNYIDYNNLDEAFTSKFIVPRNTDENNKNIVFIISNKVHSKPNIVTSMKNAFYSRQTSYLWYYGQLYLDGENIINYVGDVDDDNNIQYGLDTTKFTNLNYDNLFISNLNYLVYGEILRGINFDLSSIRQTKNANLYLLGFISDPGTNYAYSSQLILPKTTKTLTNKYICIESQSQSINRKQYFKSNQIPSGSENYYEQIHMSIEKS